MSINLEIALTTERLDEGTLEERATFGIFTICSAEQSLTEGSDFYSNEARQGPLVSGYHAAEWFAWNWWRLSWEPRSKVSDWTSAHHMSSIGDGHVWPNIVIFSDGVQMTLISMPSVRRDAKPFRYFGSRPTVVPRVLWEDAVDIYISQIIDRLRDCKIKETNLDRLWADITAERADHALSQRRRLEAMLSRDPDSVDDDAIERLVADASRLGVSVLGEVAANSARLVEKKSVPHTADEFECLAQNRGFSASQRDAVRFARDIDLPRAADVPAWWLGTAAAQALREQERLGSDPIGNKRLVELAGAGPEVLTSEEIGGAGLSFILDGVGGPDKSSFVMRTGRSTGRRFDIARLIGDRLVGDTSALHPATVTYTYRQKAQRAFAAEFLSPFDAVDGMLVDEYYDDEESRNDVAAHFDVSPKTVETLLMNHGRLEREYPEGDFDFAIA